MVIPTYSDEQYNNYVRLPKGSAQVLAIDLWYVCCHFVRSHHHHLLLSLGSASAPTTASIFSTTFLMSLLHIIKTWREGENIRRSCIVKNQYWFSYWFSWFDFEIFRFLEMSSTIVQQHYPNTVSWHCCSPKGNSLVPIPPFTQIVRIETYDYLYLYLYPCWYLKGIPQRLYQAIIILTS